MKNKESAKKFRLATTSRRETEGPERGGNVFNGVCFGPDVVVLSQTNLASSWHEFTAKAGTLSMEADGKHRNRLNGHAKTAATALTSSVLAKFAAETPA